MLAGAAALGSVAGSVPAFAVGGAGTYPQPPGAPQPHDTFVYNEGPKKGQQVKIADIVLGAPPVSVQAKAFDTGKVRQSEHSTVLLYHAKPETIPVDWRGDSADGVLAYSAMCVHDGTVMGPKDWDATKHLFVCPDCGSKYDPIHGGKVVSGPAKRELPQVPVGSDFDNRSLLWVSHGVVDWIGIKRMSY